MARKNKPKPPGGSVPTYIRFTGDQLAAMDEAVKKGSFLNRSEAARAAVRLMFGIPLNRYGVWWRTERYGVIPGNYAR